MSRNFTIDTFEPSVDTEDDRCAECAGTGEIWPERRCSSCGGHGHIIHCAECVDQAMCGNRELTEHMLAKFRLTARLANGTDVARLVCGDTECLGLIVRDMHGIAKRCDAEFARAQAEHDQQMRAAEENHRAAERSGLLEDAPTVICAAVQRESNRRAS